MGECFEVEVISRRGLRHARSPYVILSGLESAPYEAIQIQIVNSGLVKNVNLLLDIIQEDKVSPGC